MRLQITLKSIGVVLAVAAVFVAVSLFAHAHAEGLREVVKAGGVWGIAAFIVLTATFVVLLLPLDVSVLIPLATAVWGPAATALMSIAGWTMGSCLAFFLARRFGAPVVRRVAGRAQLREAERTAKRTIPKHHLFWWALLAQALLPIDLISYAFGLFTDLEFGAYALATAIGDLVPGLFFAYAGDVPGWYQIGALVFAVVVAGLLFWRLEASD
jgi:uncharacterized membrane protein YdjX (TVP38/TMEM64 family)